MRPWQFILLGFILSMLGVIFPFLMVIQVLPSTFFLNFFSYTSSITGLFLGMIGASRYVKENREK